MRNKMLAKMKFGLTARISLYERIQAFLEANIDIVNTLKSLRDRYLINKDYRGQILDEWIQNMELGGKFHDAIRPWVPPAEHMLIAAGERGGSLIQGLKEATVLSNSSAKNKNAIISGVVMPIILVTIIFLMLIGFQVQMVPVFKNLLPVDRWPDSAQNLYHVSKFFYDFWWLLVGLIIAATIVISTTMGSWTGPMRNKFDSLPPWSLYKNYQASSFLIGLSSLMKAGVANFEALRTMQRTASPWMFVHLQAMIALMKTGGTNPGEALNTGLLDPETAGDVQDYSRLGSFQNAIYIMGERTLVKSVARTVARMKVVNGLLLVMVAGGVLLIYFTSYNLQSTIAEQMQSMSH